MRNSEIANTFAQALWEFSVVSWVVVQSMADSILFEELDGMLEMVGWEVMIDGSLIWLGEENTVVVERNFCSHGSGQGVTLFISRKGINYQVNC